MCLSLVIMILNSQCKTAVNFCTKLTAQKEILQGKAGEHHGQNVTAESKWMKICKKTKTWGYQQRFGKKHGGNVYE